MALHVGVNRGTVLLAAIPYDDTIIDWVRALPERCYRRKSHDWSVPATHERLRNVCRLIAELEERNIDVQIAHEASARLARIDVDGATLRDGIIEIAGAYSERRLPALRDLPERRFDAKRRTWTVPLTRAGALALLALADETDELVTTQRAPRRARSYRQVGQLGAARSIRHRARCSEAIADRALAPSHVGPGLRQSGARADVRARHRHLRTDKGQPGSRPRRLTLSSARASVLTRPLRASLVADQRHEVLDEGLQSQRIGCVGRHPDPGVEAGGRLIDGIDDQSADRDERSDFHSRQRGMLDQGTPDTPALRVLADGKPSEQHDRNWMPWHPATRPSPGMCGIDRPCREREVAHHAGLILGEVDASRPRPRRRQTVPAQPVIQLCTTAAKCRRRRPENRHADVVAHRSSVARPDIVRRNCSLGAGGASRRAVKSSYSSSV